MQQACRWPHRLGSHRSRPPATAGCTWKDVYWRRWSGLHEKERKLQLFQCPTWKDVYLEEMVMPRSFSNSLLSITRSSLQGIQW